MNPVNRFLKLFGVGIHRLPQPSPEFKRTYQDCLKKVRDATLHFDVIESFQCDIGGHPHSYMDFECGFAASCLTVSSSKSVLDIGSYREFVLGVSSAYKTTSLDVRPRAALSDNELIVVDDAKQLKFPDGTFDAVVSLSSIEHFGLGRYGDEFDLQGDAKAMSEMKRCLKPNGFLIFSTTLTRGRPVLAFNSHRIYSLDMLREMCAPFAPVREAFFSHKLGRFCAHEHISDHPGIWDVYCGCWQKFERITLPNAAQAMSISNGL